LTAAWTIGRQRSSFAWYLRRLRMMSPEEIITMRLYRFLRDAVGSGFASRAPEGLALSIYGFTDGDRSYFFEYFQDSQAAAIRDAKQDMRVQPGN
jgi:hypothetical protein